MLSIDEKSEIPGEGTGRLEGVGGSGAFFGGPRWRMQKESHLHLITDFVREDWSGRRVMSLTHSGSADAGTGGR